LPAAVFGSRDVALTDVEFGVVEAILLISKRNRRLLKGFYSGKVFILG